MSITSAHPEPMPNFTNLKAVTWQLLREFWLPFVVAILWTVWSASPSGIDWKAGIAHFTTSFFFASWFTGNFVRVSRQLSTTSSLHSIAKRTEALIDRLEAQTNDLIGYATGGDTRSTIGPMVAVGVRTVSFVVTNPGKYPVHDLQVRVYDYSESLQDGQTYTPLVSAIERLEPGRYRETQHTFSLANKERLHLHIDVLQRNDLISYEWIIFWPMTEETPLKAHRWRLPWHSDSAWQYEVPTGFPCYDPETPEALFQLNKA